LPNVSEVGVGVHGPCGLAPPLHNVGAAIGAPGAFRRRGGTACCDPEAIEIDDNFGSTRYAADERDTLPAEAVAAYWAAATPPRCNCI
jgi:hypothetical protein